MLITHHRHRRIRQTTKRRLLSLTYHQPWHLRTKAQSPSSGYKHFLLLLCLCQQKYHLQCTSFFMFLFIYLTGYLPDEKQLNTVWLGFHCRPNGKRQAVFPLGSCARRGGYTDVCSGEHSCNWRSQCGLTANSNKRIIYWRICFSSSQMGNSSCPFLCSELDLRSRESVHAARRTKCQSSSNPTDGL